ncbi:hypothetical protein LWI28_008213 [Acer negundo]|uniref:MAPK kinase substrate protein At1g80180-like n=1 Tax=Acer negundo TaxID=4023 RepID=A0AAD5J9T4_ACENE|nr:hypothetical protein LWI28_008213 [Acer negundo]KAK4853940.1 hypothetical protein QYF36_016683 [Acer negundo]
MATFQRSEVSFRRQGSSGLVWHDPFFSGDLAHIKRQKEREAEPRELRHCQSDGSAGMVDRGYQPNGGGIIHRTRKVAPDVDPPSPKVSGCFCFGSGKSASKKGKKKF